MGTNSHAERLADLMLPGFTARMWRPRLLTLSAVASLVAEKVARRLKEDDKFGPARLAFERLYVSALVQSATKDKVLEKGIRQIPGNDRARQAYARGEPLTHRNFVKGQSVNGPTGVMARLSRSLRLVDDENRLDAKGQELVLAWAKDEELVGILEGTTEDGKGGEWLLRMADATQKAVQGLWPGSQSSLWSELSMRLRPDQMREHERRCVRNLIAIDPTGLRPRMLALLVRSIDTYNHGAEHGREVEQSVIQDGVRPLLSGSEEDGILRVLFATIDVYEKCSTQLLSAFDAIRWALSHGPLTEGQILSDRTVAKNLARARKILVKELAGLDDAIALVESKPVLEGLPIPLRQMRGDVGAGVTSSASLLAAVLDRHRRVQKEKRKGEWIVRGSDDRLELMPGFGSADAPPKYSGQYLHPYRVTNVYAMLGELGMVQVKHDDKE